MPNSIGTTGLTTATQSELLSNFTTGLQNLFGADVNLDSSTPDGQLINIFIQAILDNLDLVKQVNANFDPDQAIGILLDQRVAINGIKRQAGTYTITNISITTSKALNLQGLDLYPSNPYTVADNAGNQWQLITTQNISTAGTYAFAFQAAQTGAVLTNVNTITVPVTVVLGVTAINNPTTYSVLGVNEESDAQLRIRRQKSVSLSSQGYLKGLIAALENINGVSTAMVYENTNSITNSDGVPGKSIWVIVQGGSKADIANAIYSKRNAGCGMYGQQSYTLTQLDGTPFTIYWDNVAPQNLFIKITVSSLDGVNPPNIASIQNGLVTYFTPGVNQKVNINDLTTLIKQIDGNSLVTSSGFSTSAGGTYSPTLTPTAKNNQFAISTSNIIVLPMILNPPSSNVYRSTTQQFSTLGGYGTLTYSFQTNNSGGSIISSSGYYTAGSTSNVQDTILVTDSLGNTATATVNVT